MEDPGVILAVRFVKFSQLSAVPVHHGQVERPEVLIKWHIDEVLRYTTINTNGMDTYIVDVEEEGILVILRRLDVGNPEQAVSDDLNGPAVFRSDCLLLLGGGGPSLTRI